MLDWHSFRFIFLLSALVMGSLDFVKNLEECVKPAFGAWPERSGAWRWNECWIVEALKATCHLPLTTNVQTISLFSILQYASDNKLTSVFQWAHPVPLNYLSTFCPFPHPSTWLFPALIIHSDIRLYPRLYLLSIPFPVFLISSLFYFYQFASLDLLSSCSLQLRARMQ